jgi:hypothetical protein
LLLFYFSFAAVGQCVFNLLKWLLTTASLLIAAGASSFAIAAKEPKRPSHAPLASFSALSLYAAKPVNTTAVYLLRYFVRSYAIASAKAKRPLPLRARPTCAALLSPRSWEMTTGGR